MTAAEAHKTVVITGGTGGLGAALAMEWGRRGHAVVALYRSNEAAAEALRGALDAAGVASRVIAQDVTSPSVAQALDVDLVRDATALVLVNNACAPLTLAPLHLVAWDEVARQLDVAVKGSYLCTRALLRALVAKRGTVVNVLSSAATGDASNARGFGGYGIAKSALAGLSRALAADYGAQGLRVFSVSPGYMETRLTEAWDERVKERLRGGARTPTDVARAIVDLVDGPAPAAGRGEDHPL